MDAHRKWGIIRISDLNETLILLVYFILALEYDLYNHFGLGNIISSTLLTFVEIAILIFVILTTRRKVMSHYIMYGFLFLGIIWTYFTAPECRRIMTELFFEGSSVKKVFILPLALHCIKRPKDFSNKFYCLSVVEGYIHILCNMLWGYGYNEWGVFYYMTYGMALLTPTCFVMQRTFSKPTKLNIITLIIFELNIIVYGHRGALLVTAVMMMLFFIKYVNVRKKLVIGLVGIFVFFVLYLFGGQLIQFVIGIMNNMGLESRTLEKLLSGGIADDSERYMIWGIMIANIMKLFPFGAGIGSDRIVLGSAMRRGLYAHNFIFELCLDYGLIIGIIIVGWIVWICYRTLTKINDESWAHLIQPILIPSVITLLTSASIYQYWLFWFSLGLYYNYFDRRRGQYMMTERKGRSAG